MNLPSGKRLNLFLGHCLLLAAVAVAAPCASAQACGEGASAAPHGPWRWPGGTSVTVRALGGAFNAAELRAIEGAVSFWDSALSDSGLRLRYDGEATGVSDLPGAVTVTRVPVYENGRHLAETSAFFEPGSRVLVRWSIVRIDPRLTDPEQLRSVFAHELGHTLGLDDCPECAHGTTIMASYRGLNKGNGLVNPSRCDVALVYGQYGPAQNSAAKGFAQGGGR